MHFYSCTAKSVISGEISGHFGSPTTSTSKSIGGRRGRKSGGLAKSRETSELQECLWVIESSKNNDETSATIEFDWEQTNNEDFLDSFIDDCKAMSSRVYIYDGLPDFVSDSQRTGSAEAVLLGAFCVGQRLVKPVQATSGHMTVYYKRSPQEYHSGFNASFDILQCPYNCNKSNRKCNEFNQCVCVQGFGGRDCLTPICPNDCGAGFCNNKTNLCECTKGFTGSNCTEKDLGQLHDVDLFNLDLLPDPFKHYKKLLPRFGNSLDSDSHGLLWLFGGYSYNQGPLNDVRAFDVNNGSWIPITVHLTAELPEARYFHASVLVASEKMLYIQGGMNSSHYFDDMWRFDILRRTWEFLPQRGPYPDYTRFDLAGHTMTYMPDDNSLIIIGGYSESKGFSNQVLKYKNKALRPWHTAHGFGPMAGGIYGHSTVYNRDLKSFYVFGGVAYDKKRVAISNRLFVLHYPTRRWSIVPISSGRMKPQPRALHSAVTSDSYMILFGGITEGDWNWRDALSPISLYVYSCGMWINLNNNLDSRHPALVGPGLAIDRDARKESVYTLGGYRGSLSGSLEKMVLPKDYCNLFQTDPLNCKSTLGCALCSVFDDENSKNASFCYSNDALLKPATCTSFQSGTLEFSVGVKCNISSYIMGCHEHMTCGECLSVYPNLDQDQDVSRCVWCPGCNRGKCVPRGTECDHRSLLCTRLGKQVRTASQCPDMNCAASDCQQCRDLGNRGQSCRWTRERYGHEMDFRPIYDWSCEPEVNATSTSGVSVLSRSDTCPRKCYEIKSCQECLESEGSEGGWSECRWSTDLNQCISPSYLPLKCAGGICGTVLAGNTIQWIK